MAAGADFIGGQGAGLSRRTAHQNEHFHIFPALGAFHFLQARCDLAFLATSDDQAIPSTYIKIPLQ
jgi:hypothetical protein